MGSNPYDQRLTRTGMNHYCDIQIQFCTNEGHIVYVFQDLVVQRSNHATNSSMVTILKSSLESEMEMQLHLSHSSIVM